MLKLFGGTANIRSSFPHQDQTLLYRAMATAASHGQLKVSNLFNVSKFTVVVTGGGSGIGLMITQALTANGAKVYITGRREEALKTVVDQYSKGPGRIVAQVFPLDL
jgi:NADPH:quinone reductase-like Zn-dependent oxidoreductase